MLGQTNQDLEKTRMKITLSRTILFLLVVALPVFGQAKEPVHHHAYSILFEIIEDGVISSKRVSLEFAANAVDGTTWAECRIAVITINDDKKRMELDTYYCSTDQATIKNLKIDSEVVSFEMIPYPMAPDRPLKLVAVRKKSEPHLYQVSVVGLWTGLWMKEKLVKIEWRQVPSIKLPYTTIGK
jgi:hypothetical protein